MQKKLDYLEVQKYSYIEQLLLWRGRVQRRDLIQKFSLSESSAAVTFRSYLIARPGGLVLDRSIKAYRPPQGFRPIYYQPDLADCELPILKSGLEVVIPPNTLQVLAEVIRDKKTMHIEYLSLDDQRTEREIAPLCMIRMIEAFPEALCAWCFLRNDIRNFQLPLIQAASIGRPVPEEVANYRLPLGSIRYRGKDLIVPRASIYAVASQIVSVPELRDAKANESIKELSIKLEKEWVPLQEESRLEATMDLMTGGTV